MVVLKLAVLETSKYPGVLAYGWVRQKSGSETEAEPTERSSTLAGSLYRTGTNTARSGLPSLQPGHRWSPGLCYEEATSKTIEVARQS